MQGNRFYPLFMHYKPKQLYEVVVNNTDFEAEAVDAAMFLINEQGLLGGLEIAQKKFQEKKIRAKEEKEIEKQQKEEHLQKVSTYQEDGVVFGVPLGDVKQFEDKLSEAGIEFYRNDSLEGFEVDSAPTQNYYFGKKYLKEVNLIVKEIELGKISQIEKKKTVKHLEIYVLVGVVIIIGVVFKVLNIF
jgi:hypothetical protein